MYIIPSLMCSNNFRFIDRLNSVRWETVTTMEEMENEDEIREEIRKSYQKR